MESESLKIAKQFLGKDVEVIIDRPVGSRHPKHDFLYELNYGYIKDVKAPDGEDLDAYYIGSDKPLKQGRGKCIAVIHRKKDDDDKLVVSETDLTNDQIEELVNFQEKYFIHEIIR